MHSIPFRVLLRRLSVALLFGCSVLPQANFAEETATKKPGVLVLYGPPGSGRAKLAIKLTQHFHVPKISFAELLSEAFHEDSKIGDMSREYMNKGGAIPLDLFWMILDRRMNMQDCKQGCLWEGIPCTVEQAHLAKEKFSSQFEFIVFSIDASHEWLAQRVSGRFFCKSCGQVYNDTALPLNNQELICENCGDPLSKRVEDSKETIEARCTTYGKSMSPVLQFWKEQSLLNAVEGNHELDEIYCAILNGTEARSQRTSTNNKK